jgi:hypothetical protein
MDFSQPFIILADRGYCISYKDGVIVILLLCVYGTRMLLNKICTQNKTIVFSL